MSQVSGRPCPACGTPVPAGQRFCSNCGTDMEVSRPASQYGGPPPQNFPQAQPVPPYAQSPYGQQQQYQQYQQPPQKSNPIAEALGALGLLFFLRRYRPGYRARRQSSGCCGCLVTLFILLIILGIPAYVVYKNNPRVIQQIQQNFNNSNSGNSGSGAMSETVNLMFTYASLDVTITSVQYAQSFSDDSSVTSGGVRVAFKETAGPKAGGFLYSDVARLILADQSVVAPRNAQYGISPTAATSRTNWIDFPVTSQPADLSKLVLQMGTTQENQMQIPLHPGADLSKYQTKIVNPNIPISYAGLNWTLKTATSSLSADGKQATTGMRYVVLLFNVDNPTSGTVTIGFTDEYMRLKSGDIINQTINTTLPLQISGNTTGKSGTVTFQMPVNGSAFTLIFLVRPVLSNTQVNTNFTI